MKSQDRLYPLTPLQQGMLFHSLSSPKSGVDIEQINMCLNEPLETELFTQAWQIVISRHDILRTHFKWQGHTEPMQVVGDGATLPITQHDLREESAESQQKTVQSYREQDRYTDFDMSAAPLMRIAIFELGKAHFQVVWTFHHLLLDGRSFPLVITELFDIYEMLVAGGEPTLPLPRPYRDHIDWLQTRDERKSHSFWQKQLKGFSEPTTFDFGPLRPHNHNLPWDVAVQTLSAELTQNLRTFAETHDVTLHTLLQAAWGILLHHYSGNKDIVFGSTRAGRYGIDGAKEMIGMFINTVPMRARLVETTSLLTYLRDLRQQQIAIRPHEHSALTDIQKVSDVNNGGLFNTLVVFEQYLLNTRLRSQGGNWLKREFVYRGQTNYPLTLMAYDDEELLLRLEYSTGTFSAETMQRMAGHLSRLLERMLDNASRPALNIPYLTPSEAHQMLVEWQPKPTPLPQWLTHQQITAQALAYPHKIAVICGDQKLTYQQLDERSNQLAHHLQAYGIRNNNFVGLFIERSIETIIGLLGILKSGGAYVPLDPAYPRDRLDHMIADSAMRVIVAHSNTVDALPKHEAHTVLIDQLPADLSVDDPLPAADAEDLAYVIYTSGSTGKPKGVQVPHIALANFLQAMQAQPGFTQKDILVAVTTISFDIAALEMYLPLISGGTLIIADGATVTNGAKLAELLDQHDATIMQATPATWQMLIDAGWQGHTQLKMLCGGEPLSRRLADALLTRGGELWNMYGPTETTIWSTISQVFADQQPIHIGTPINNTTAFILDGAARPMPVGVVGELCLGGAGVTYGYLRRPILTAEKFVTFTEAPYTQPTTIYHTGDLARWREDGTIECLGRLDHQVKIRGYRIELGEIEAILAQHDAIENAVVTAYKTDGAENAQLVAYIIENTDARFSASDVKKYCKTKLPTYMVPATFVTLGAFPLTDNGKIKRRALPAPTGDRPQLDHPFVAPRNHTEKTIADIWQQILVVNQIGIDDSFFDLGGDSLSIVRAVGQLRDRFHSNLPIHKLFQFRTIRDLSIHLNVDADPVQVTSSSRFDVRAAKRKAAMQRRRRIVKDYRNGH